MKKYLLSLLLVVFIIPSIAFASWWNPFSWFTKQSQTVQTTLPVNGSIIINTDTKEQKTISASVNNKKKITTNNTEKKSTSVSTPVVSQIVAPPVYDVCKNIEGIQTIAPSGMYVDNGNCLPVVSNNTQQQTTNVPPPTPTGTLCNGKYYSSCSTGNDFICPSNGGGAFCQPSQSQKLAVLQAQLQMYQNELPPIDAEIQKYQNQSDSQGCSDIHITLQLGEQGQANLLKSQNCLAISQAENSAIQQKTPILNQISYIQQQIFNLSY